MELDEWEKVINHNLQVKNMQMIRLINQVLKQGVAPPMTKEERFEHWKKTHRKEYNKLASFEIKKIKEKQIKAKKEKQMAEEIIEMRNRGIKTKEIANILGKSNRTISYILKENKELIKTMKKKLKTMTFTERQIQMVEEIKEKIGLATFSSVIHQALSEYYKSLFPAYLNKDKNNERNK